LTFSRAEWLFGNLYLANHCHAEYWWNSTGT
jgi:hypothetical protein